jgi:uridine kinase
MMKGDVIVIEEYHRQASEAIVSALMTRLEDKPGRFSISVAGESGSGKSEAAAALSEAFASRGIKSVVFGQDDYFVLPPKSNDRRRRQDPEWLGPHCEVRFDILQANLDDALGGASSVVKPIIDYNADSVSTETVDLAGVKIVIVEGTYVSLLKRIDARVFITRSKHETLEHRTKRKRGAEVGDPFIEGILGIEHKIIAGHRSLADFVITRDYDVVPVP